MSLDKGCVNCGNDELCDEVSTNCVYYKGDGCESKGIESGDSLTSVIDKLSFCDENDITNTSVNNDVETCDVFSQPQCLQGVNYSPINYSLDGNLLLSYDLTQFINSLGSDFSLIRSRVSGYSTTSIFDSTNLQGGYNIPFAEFPITLDFDIVVNSKCGRIQFKKTIVVGCNSIGSFGATPDVLGGGEITLDSQDKYNKHLLSEISRLTNLIDNQSNISLPTCDLIPNSNVSTSSALVYTADAVCKLDDRLKSLESINPCSDECQNCPGGEKIGLEEVIKQLCSKLDEQSTLISTLTERVVELESYH